MLRMSACVLLSLYAMAAQGQQYLNHDLSVTIDPSQSHLEVSDTLQLPGHLQTADEITFRLNSNLVFTSLQGDNYRIEPLDANAGGTVADAGREIAPASRYRLVLD